jgi:FMN reductase
MPHGSPEAQYRPIRIVALGGTTAPVSSTERAMDVAAMAAEAAGAEVTRFGRDTLVRLPHYQTAPVESCAEARALLEGIRGADGLILASPGWHGSISGLLKNAIDYLEETARDERPYLDGIAVGLIATAYGWQATGSTLATLRTIVHALRGWPTPLGAAINCSGGIFREGQCTDPSAQRQLESVGRQVVEFARMRRALAAGS